MRLAIPVGWRRGGTVAAVASRSWGSIAAAVLITGVGATLAHDRLFHGPERTGERESSDPSVARVEATPAGFDPRTTVSLAPGKFRSAGVEVGTAREVRLAREVAVTGRIEADPNRRIEVRPRAAGVVESVAVQPGSIVRAGDVLVVLSSAEVGSARLLVRERQRALLTARAEATFKRQVADNAEAMIARLRSGADAETVGREFGDRVVGTARGTLVAAWAELELAEHEFEKQSLLNKRNIVGEHPLFVAVHTREGAQARFTASLEQVRYDVAQNSRVAQQAARDAEGMVVDAAQRLQILGVAVDIAALLDHPEVATDSPSDFAAVTRYPIVAPFDGTVTAVAVTASRRVEVADLLVVVTDLSVVRAVASIPEADFGSLSALSGGTVRLSASAYPDRTFAARMLYTGAEVDPTTRTVRLVAEVDNPDGLFKLGLFTRIALDSRATESATVVPPGALVDIDGAPSVFRPDPGHPRTFTRLAVRLGRVTPEGRVVAGGLRPGDPIVVAGAFQLKSELILQNEADEE